MENRSESVHLPGDPRTVKLIGDVLERVGGNNTDAVLEELGAPRLYSSTTLVFSMRKRQLVALLERWSSFMNAFPQTGLNSFLWIDSQYGLSGREIVRFPLQGGYETWKKRKLVTAILAFQHLLLLILRDCGVKGAEYLLDKYGKSTLRVSSPQKSEGQSDARGQEDGGAGYDREDLMNRIRELGSQIESAARAAEALHSAEKAVREVALYLRSAYAEEIAGGEHANQTLCQVLCRYLEKERRMAKASPLRRMWLALRLW